MGVAALVIAMVAVVFAILPLVYTQLMAVVIGVVAVVLGVWARVQARSQGRPAGMATAGAAVGVAAVLLGVAIYGTLMHAAGKVGDQLVDEIGSELARRRNRGDGELLRAVDRAIQRARAGSAKSGTSAAPPGATSPD